MKQSVLLRSRRYSAMRKMNKRLGIDVYHRIRSTVKDVDMQEIFDDLDQRMAGLFSDTQSARKFSDIDEGITSLAKQIGGDDGGVLEDLLKENKDFYMEYLNKIEELRYHLKIIQPDAN